MHERLMSAGVRRTARAKKRASSRVPIVSLGLLVLLVALCLLADLLAPGDPSYMNLAAAGQAPSAAHPLGTDALGRDVFAMLLHGGRVSLFIGACAAGISALVGRSMARRRRWLLAGCTICSCAAQSFCSRCPAFCWQFCFRLPWGRPIC